MAFKAKPRSEMDISACSEKQESDVRVQEEEEVLLCESSSTSSFGDSMCSSDDDDGDGENEAHSRLCREYPLPEIFDYGAELLGLRKKKVTQEWRRSTQHLSWRGKWLELKFKELLSHSRWYDNKAKTPSDTKDKSIPLTFKRGRRKRVEETTDVAAYRSNHSIFAYADKRMQATVKPHDSDFGTGRKATSKEDGNEDDCLVSELDCSKDFLPSLLWKIEEAQERTARLQNRVDQLMMESQAAPQTVAPLEKDLTAKNGKQRALVEEADTAARNQKEATVQIGRQRISADHTEDVLVPPVEIDVQCLNNYSPISSGGFGLNILEDLLMDEPDINEDEIDMHDYFRKIMNDITGVEDPTPVNKRRKTTSDSE